MNDAEFENAARERLIVALDVPSSEGAIALVEWLGDAVTFYKLGLGLLVAGGSTLARQLRDKKKSIFLDFKFHDIGAQVGWAAESAAKMGGSLLTVHCDTQAMRAAVGVRDRINVDKPDTEKLRVIAVTVLTNTDQQDLKNLGYEGTLAAAVKVRAKAAFDAGCDGVVASANEISLIRSVVPNTKFIVVTPGIRPQGSDLDDQKRVTTPFQAVDLGADYLVVGRPIIAAADPLAAAKSILDEMAKALRKKSGSTEDSQEGARPRRKGPHTKNLPRVDELAGA